MKIFRRYIVALMIAALLILLFFKAGWLGSLNNIFKAQPVVIDNTPILIKEINELAQLCTITVYDEVVVDSTVIQPKSAVEMILPDFSKFSGLPVTGKRIVVIGKGKVVAGTDLKKLEPRHFFIGKDSISLTLPKAEILDAIINPSGFETFDELGNWSSEAVTAVKIKARNKMVERALQQKILEKAAERSSMLMENFLRSAGFKKITVRAET
ncbi:MAG: DUF4230 domain-containing protein [Chitinophagaceae bacterium]|nr:DUF4230 domain-containing protein [Chitinophagaceae bacterium]